MSRRNMATLCLTLALPVILILGCSLEPTLPASDTGVKTNVPTITPSVSPLTSADTTPDSTSDTTERTSETSLYQRIEISDLGLVYEIPENWHLEANKERWVTDEAPGAFIGVKWMDMDAPQEPEAVMLPRPSQIIFSGDYDFEGNPGRMIGLETYAYISEGNEEAPVETVETHMLVVLSPGQQRRALDVYAGAESQAELESIIAVYQHLLEFIQLLPE